MLEWIAIILSLGSAAVAIAALVRVRMAERMLEDAARQVAVLPSRTEPDIVPESPLQGLVIGISVAQDHDTPVLAATLAECFQREDVDSVTTGENVALADIVIDGFVVCNGYADVYYEASLDCKTSTVTLFSIREKPPSGDRPMNLALEIVSRLKTELTSRTTREERRLALRELGIEPSPRFGPGGPGPCPPSS